MPKAKFTKPFLEKLLREKPEKPVTYFDEKQVGLCVLHGPGRAHSTEATVTFQALYYTEAKRGSPRYTKIGRYGETVYYRDLDGNLHTLDCGDLEAVRRRCSEIRNAAKGAGVDPKRERLGDTIGEIAERYIASPDVQNQKLPSETKRIFDRYILPEWRDRKADDLMKSDVAALLDKIAAGRIEYNVETKTGKPRKRKAIGTPAVAVTVYGQLQSLFKYHGARSDTFKSPLVPEVIGKSWNPKNRERVLTCEEIKALWQATGGCEGEYSTTSQSIDVYGACIRMALLTAQRFFKVGHMRRSEIKNGVWDARKKDDPEKKKVSEVALTPFAQSIINEVPIIYVKRGGQDYVFTLNGRKPFGGWDYHKALLDKRMSEILGREIEPWQQRDLRRTARTLMTAAGVIYEVGEACLAHEIGKGNNSVGKIYARYKYTKEKRAAFAKLSDLIEKIIAGEFVDEDMERELEDEAA